MPWTSAIPCAAARLTRMPENEPGPIPTMMRRSLRRGRPRRTSAGNNAAEWRCGPVNSIDWTTTWALPSAMLPREEEVSKARSSMALAGRFRSLPDHPFRQADNFEFPVPRLGRKHRGDSLRPFDDRHAVARQVFLDPDIEHIFFALDPVEVDVVHGQASAAILVHDRKGG